MAGKLGERDRQGILPRKPIEQLEFEAAQQLDTLYSVVSSVDAVRAEDELRARLFPLENGVINVEFVLEQISPIVLEALIRRGKREVVLSKGRPILPEVYGVDYVINSYPYNTPQRGFISLAGNLLAKEKGASIADALQGEWDLSVSARRGISKLGQLRQADLVNIFRGARPV